MTCYNRRETTLRCLRSLYGQQLPEYVSFEVFLVDDGCTDGTGEAVKAVYSDIRVIRGNGTLFWCNGMRLAWEHAAKTDPDFYLWLNDDTVLSADAVMRLLDAYKAVFGAGAKMCESIIVGSCFDPDTGKLTYGGQKKRGAHPAKLDSVAPQNKPVPCETFQGNLVLVSRGVFERVGNMRPFSHAMGDTDYGYRAVKAGCGIWVAPGFYGECDLNVAEDIYALRHLSVRQRFKVVKKRLPPLDWFRLLWFHSGLAALIYWPLPYIRVLIKP
jgi:GT2 family glycosyltransferase